MTGNNNIKEVMMRRIILVLSLMSLLAVFGRSGTTTPVFAQDQEMEMPLVVVSAKWHPHGEGLLVIGRGDVGVWGVWIYDTNLRPIHFIPTEDLVSADWSPDGTRLSMGRNIVDAKSMEILLTLDANSGIGGWSPDGTQVLAWAGDNNLGLFDSMTGKLVRKVFVGEMYPDAVSWSPDGAYFALVQPIGTTDIISAKDGRVLITIATNHPAGLSWSPDSRHLAGATITEVEPDTPGKLPFALGSFMASVVVWDINTGAEIQKYPGLLATPGVLRWHPHKPELAAAIPLGLVYTWDTETGQQTSILSTMGGLGSIDYSPYGGRLILGASVLQQAFLDSQRESLLPQARYPSQNVVANTLAMIVPNPSVELLQSVEAACVPAGVSADAPSTDMAVQNPAAYVDAVKQNAAIPPGCAADLVAVAEALAAQ